MAEIIDFDGYVIGNEEIDVVSLSDELSELKKQVKNSFLLPKEGRESLSRRISGKR